MKKQPVRKQQRPVLVLPQHPAPGRSGAAVPAARQRPARQRPARQRQGVTPVLPQHAAPGGSGAAVKPAKAAVRKKKPVKRKLPLGEAVACCAAEALAASLRLTGWPVTDRDVLALYELTAGDENEGASILATLEAAAEHGLAGVRPLTWECVNDAYNISAFPTPLILGADLPGPHALCDDGTAWWSWGEPYDPAAFPGAVVEEAWEVWWPR